MLRRSMFATFGALTLAAIGLVTASNAGGPAKLSAPCACCGETCGCTVCVCDANAAQSACDCCGPAACCSASR
jgi:hypothetical protein